VIARKAACAVMLLGPLILSPPGKAQDTAVSKIAAIGPNDGAPHTYAMYFNQFRT
jgi:hypothetical protein